MKCELDVIIDLLLLDILLTIECCGYELCECEEVMYVDLQGVGTFRFGFR